jgi:choline kinase
MKALIIAAGKGQRLSKYTKDMPKCMLTVGDKSILDHQLDALAANGVTEVGIVKGYMADTIDRPDMPSFLNSDFENNNILLSLMYAAEFLDDDIIISYSDIIYSKEVVATLAASEHDISAVVDTDWRERYIGRDAHPVSEAEKALFDIETGRAKDFGKVIDASPEHIGEFIGLFKLSKKGAQAFKKRFYEAEQIFSGKPFIHAKSFAKAYITDHFNYMIECGEAINCAFIQKEWWEIDTEQDLEGARQWLKQPD